MQYCYHTMHTFTTKLNTIYTQILNKKKKNLIYTQILNKKKKNLCFKK